ncbi:MAG: hypothetical protein CMI54_01725 [Parcubacteria group bacterium]|nr:hypothetical protein [Parcubacteria group bacterium]
MSEIKEDKMSDDKKRDVHIKAIRRFHETFTADEDQRELAALDLRFAQVEGAQWDEWSRRNRQDLPTYEINHVASAVAQVTGAYKENQISTKVRGANSGATKDVADTFEGLLRTIESRSNAKDAYDTAHFLLVNTGFAAWQVSNQFEDNGFDQELVITPITSPLTSVWWDNGARAPNKQDANWAFLVRGFTKEAYEENWPDKPINSFDNGSLRNNEFNQHWFKNDLIQVADYYVKEPVKRTLIRLSDGRDVWLDKVEPVLDELAQKGIIERKRRVVNTKKVVKYIMNGSEILSGPHPTPFKTIPLVAVYGENHYEEDNHYFRGMVRMAKDAQRIYNWNISTNVETMAKAPQDPYWVTPKQLKGHEDDYSRMAIDNDPYMLYNPDPEAPVPARTGSPSFNQASAAVQQQSAADIQITTGRPTRDIPSNVGQEILLAAKKQVDAGSQVFVSAMTRAVQYTAELLIQAAPVVYDQQRQIRITNADGTTEFVAINETVMDNQTGEEVIVNDLSQGRYDVASSTGPAFETARTATANALAAMAQFDASIIETSRDLMVKSIDSPVADEVHKRIRKAMIQQGTVEPTDEELEEMQPTPEEQEAQQRQVEFEQKQLQLQMEAQEANNAFVKESARKAAADADKANAEVVATFTKTEKTIADTEAVNAKTIDQRAKTQETLTKVVSDKIEKGLPVTESNLEALESNADLLNADIDEDIQTKIEQEQQILNNQQSEI